MVSHFRYPMGLYCFHPGGGVTEDMNRGLKENSRSENLNMLICICNAVSTHKNVKTTVQEED